MPDVFGKYPRDYEGVKMAETTEWIPETIIAPAGTKVTIEFPNGSAYQLTSDGRTVTKQAIEIGDCLVAFEMQESIAAQAAETHRRVVRDLLKDVVRCADHDAKLLFWLQEIGFFNKDLEADEILADVFRDWDGE